MNTLKLKEKIEKKIRKGIRQQCILSLCLINILIEAIIKLKEETEEIKINVKLIHCNSLADDIVLVAD